MASDPSAKSPPRIVRGTTTVLLAFDIAFAVDLDVAERLLSGAAAERATIRHTRKAPPYFEYRPSPLRITLPAETVAICEGFATSPQVEILIFDFGAVSVAYRVPLAGTLDGLVDLSESLYDNKAIEADAYKRLQQAVALIGPAVQRPLVDKAVEDYIIHQIEEIEGRAEPADVLDNHGELIARIMRAERGPMSGQEAAEALSASASYRPGDAALIDWNAAVLLDREAEDVKAVLEFANVEALEMRVLDDRLDQVLDESYRALVERKGRLGGFIPFPGRGPMTRVARLQIESALLYEAVNNAIKLVGDQYLARVYRLAANRFHLPERDASIERKLSTVQSIYTKIEDAQNSLRMEVLEWIIILLISFEVAYSIFAKK